MLNDDQTLEEAIVEAKQEFREDLKDSKLGYLKLVAFESIPVVMGVSLGTIGRLTGMPELILAPPVIDIGIGGNIPHSYTGLKEFVGMYIKYGLGVALPYADKLPEIYDSLQGIL
tara:strand:- start:165 stop:509 length:345 start_codon:yes stop_codon:yes gene_type:complete